MTFDFQSLSTEPLIYMLMHSGAFVCILGFIFFVVGMLFGYGTWGRYKRQTRLLQGEAEAMKGEIAVLKRKIGDHSIKSGPTIPMATETIYMPKREKEGTAAATEAAPAITADSITTQDVRPPAPPAEVASTKPQPKPPANIITAKALPPATMAVVPAALNGAAAPVKEEPAAPPPASSPPAPLVPDAVQDGAAALNGAAPAPEAALPPAEPAAASIALSDSESPPPERHTSPLAAIIAAPHVKAEPESEAAAAEPAVPAAAEGLVPADSIPAQTEPAPELPVSPLPELETHPVLDPKLGLIFKSRPGTADDLTALKGISRVLEKRLNEIGIYTFSQIAAWDEYRIKEFSAQLSFKDRIQREHWVEQAGKLAASPVTV